MAGLFFFVLAAPQRYRRQTDISDVLRDFGIGATPAAALIFAMMSRRFTARQIFLVELRVVIAIVSRLQPTAIRATEDTMVRLSKASGVAGAALLIGAWFTAPPVAAAPVNTNWTGFYLGGNLGAGWGTDSENSTSSDAIGTNIANSSANLLGLLAGGHLGYNYELPSHVVVGFETDIDWADINGTTPTSCSTYTSVNTGLDAYLGETAGCGHNRASLDNFGTVRGRLGYAWDSVLLYGTGGWVWGNASNTHTITCVANGVPGACTGDNTGAPFSGGVASYGTTLSGWTAGAGVEWAFQQHWTFRAEYLHLGFGDVTSTFVTPITVDDTSYEPSATVKSKMNADVVRFGLTYLLN